MSKVNTTGNKVKIVESKKVLFMILLIFITLILISLSVLVWYNTRQTALLQMSQNTSSKADYYANEIELKNNKIEAVLLEIASSNVPDLDKPDIDWKEQATFYIQNFEGIESIIWVDKEFLIKDIATISSTDFSINQSTMNFSSDINYLYSLEPSYKDNELKGFVFGEISILKLVLSAIQEAQDNYEIQIYEDEELIYSSVDWELSKTALQLEYNLI